MSALSVSTALRGLQAAVHVSINGNTSSDANKKHLQARVNALRARIYSSPEESDLALRNRAAIQELARAIGVFPIEEEISVHSVDSVVTS